MPANFYRLVGKRTVVSSQLQRDGANQWYGRFIHIIMVKEKKPEGIQSFDSVRNEIKTILTKEKGMELRKEKKGLLEKKYGVSINEKLLSTKIK